MSSNNFFIIFFIYINFSKDSSAKFYQNNKERTHTKACERYQSLSKAGKDKKQQYGRQKYKNLQEDEKKEHVEFRKNIS